MMFGLGSFNLINEFERASNEPNAEQLASSSARLQPYLQAKEPEPSKIEGQMVGQSKSHRTTTSGMKMKSTKYTYNPPRQEL